MSVDYITWRRGVYKTSYHFQNAEDFDNQRSKVLNSSLIFPFFYSDGEFVENKPSMHE
jgi:hypothetical protein